MSKRQATQRKNPQKKGSMRQNDSSNRQQARAGGGPARVRGNGPPQFAPTARARKQQTESPGIQMARDGSKCRIVQRELIDVIQSSSTAFTIAKRLRCNPASEVTFPWLSTIARSFETYKFRKLHFQLIARAPTTTSGSVIMSPDYDAQDGAPTTEAQASAMKGSVEAAPWQDQTLRLDPAAMNRTYKAHFTMNDARFNATNQDEKTIDVAQAFISLDLDSNSIKVAKLWVDYDVELFTPQPPEVSGAVDGGTMVIGVSADNPNNVRGTYANSPATTTVFQDVSKPLFEVIDNSVINSGNLARMLRDWTGNVDYLYNNSTATAFAGSAPNIFINGVAKPASTTSPYNYFASLLNGATGQNATYNTGHFLEAIALKKGDIVGLNPTGISFNAAPANIDSMLRFGASSFGWI